MQDFVTFESYPTHPLGARESWPATGPIYGFPELDIKPAPSRSLWQRLIANASEVPDNMSQLPSNSPIWY